MNKPTVFAAKLKALREAAGMTQTEVASALDVTMRQVQRYEKDVYPKPDKIRILNTLFDYDFFSLMNEEYDSVSQAAPEENESFLTKRRKQKDVSNVHTAPLIPAKAQAGYAKALGQEVQLDQFEKYSLPPGIDPHGQSWAYWEIEGDSMEPTFHNGDLILASQVHALDWDNLRNYYVYVIVTHEQILIKRIFCKNQREWVLISDNENLYPQQLLLSENVKEIWVFRRHIDNKAPPPKKFEIKI